jgi:soluble lytic murein transglycosylase-like protein
MSLETILKDLKQQQLKRRQKIASSQAVNQLPQIQSQQQNNLPEANINKITPYKSKSIDLNNTSQLQNSINNRQPVQPLSNTANLSNQLSNLQSLNNNTANNQISSSGNGDVDSAVKSAAKQYGVDEKLIYAIIGQESGGNAKAKSNKGASGIMQLMPATAKSLGVTDIYDVGQNINAGVKYFKQQLDTFGTVDKALAAYNAGPGNVKKYGGIPPFKETQAYVKKILSNYYK